MAIIKRSLGNNERIIIKYFREYWSDGLGGLAFKAFCDGWGCAWQECIKQSPKLKNEREEKLKKENEQYKDALAKKFEEVCQNVLSVFFPKLKAENKRLREELERLQGVVGNEDDYKSIEKVLKGK